MKTTKTSLITVVMLMALVLTAARLWAQARWSSILSALMDLARVSGAPGRKLPGIVLHKYGYERVF